MGRSRERISRVTNMNASGAATKIRLRMISVPTKAPLKLKVPLVAPQVCDAEHTSATSDLTPSTSDFTRLRDRTSAKKRDCRKALVPATPRRFVALIRSHTAGAAHADRKLTRSRPTGAT